MDEIDIWRTAALLIRQHGEDASFVAGKRADELLAQNDFLGCTVWMRIVHAIGDLAREKPREGEAVN